MGWVAETFDPRAALALGGTATLAACLYGYLRLPVLDVSRIPAVTDVAIEDPRREPAEEAI